MAEIRLEQEIASLIHFILAGEPELEPYFAEVPEQFKYPSVYFPVPESYTENFSFSEYRQDFAWHINFFAEDTLKAYRCAAAIQEKIAKGRLRIPLYNGAGEKTDKNFKVKNPISIFKIDEGVIKMSILWPRYQGYEKDNAIKSNNIGIIGAGFYDGLENKPENVYQAYQNAIDNYLQTRRPD